MLRRPLAPLLVGLVVIGVVFGTALGVLLTRREPSGGSASPAPTSPAASASPAAADGAEASPDTGGIAHSPTSGGAPSPSAPSGGVPSPSDPSGRADPRPLPSPAPTEAGTVLSPQEVAVAFVYAWATFDWRDQPSPLAGQLARATPLVTPDFHRFLSEIREPPFLTSEQIRTQTTRTVTEIDNCSAVPPSSETLQTFWCLFILTTDSTEMEPTGRGPYWEITIVKRNGVWLVDGYRT